MRRREFIMLLGGATVFGRWRRARSSKACNSKAATPRKLFITAGR
jgi:hypothetical protein